MGKKSTSQRQRDCRKGKGEVSSAQPRRREDDNGRGIGMDGSVVVRNDNNENNENIDMPRESVENDNDNEQRFVTRNKPQFRTFQSSSSSSTLPSTKVVLDDRFSSLLTDPRFQLDIRDRYGRSDSKKKKKNNKYQEQLNAFYSVEQENGKSTKDHTSGQPRETTDTKKAATKGSRKGKQKDDRDNDDDKVEDETPIEQDQDPVSRITYLTALSRGELDVSSSSSSSEDEEDEKDNAASSDDEDVDDEDDEHDIWGKAGILDPSYHAEHKDQSEEQELTYESSRYLAVLNMDWSHVRAVDILAIVSSFVPPGAIEKVQVYHSDFGMEQMAKEDQLGPSNVWRKKKTTQTTDATNDNVRDGLLAAKPDEESDEENDTNDDGEGNEEEESDDQNEDEEEYDDYPLENFLPKEDHVESDFDPEKLRAYEASRLKYHFAIVYFTEESHADLAYREVDGMELEHSSAAMDVRAIASSELASVIDGRPLRDEATSLSSNYVPPDFVVNALQQTNVKCTWESGDADRDRVLTKYYSSRQDWKALSESDDIKAYLASDGSSDDDGDGDDSDIDLDTRDKGTKGKAARMRKILGLDPTNHDDEEEENNDDSNGDDVDGEPDKEEEDSEGSSKENTKARAEQASRYLSDDVDYGQSSSVDIDDRDSDNDDEVEEEQGKQIRYIPGSKEIADKIRSKVDMKQSAKSLTPWEKFQEKKREKKRERKREARAKREETNRVRRGNVDKLSSKQKMANGNTTDGSFLLDCNEAMDQTVGLGGAQSSTTSAIGNQSRKVRAEELELLVAGDDRDEVQRDFDMRGLQRLEKNKDKKFKGKRKRKEAELASTVTGTEFNLDLQDDRFKAVLDGRDDRFGIDRTNPQFQDTPAMRKILEEQTRRRRRRNRKQQQQEPEQQEPEQQAPKRSKAAHDDTSTSQGATTKGAADSAEGRTTTPKEVAKSPSLVSDSASFFQQKQTQEETRHGIDF